MMRTVKFIGSVIFIIGSMFAIFGGGYYLAYLQSKDYFFTRCVKYQNPYGPAYGPNSTVGTQYCRLYIGEIKARDE